MYYFWAKFYIYYFVLLVFYMVSTLKTCQKNDAGI